MLLKSALPVTVEPFQAWITSSIPLVDELLFTNVRLCSEPPGAVNVSPYVVAPDVPPKKKTSPASLVFEYTVASEGNELANKRAHAQTADLIFTATSKIQKIIFRDFQRCDNLSIG